MKYRAEPEDKSSFQHEIVYALNELEQALSVSIRKTKWLPLDEVWELLLNVNPNITRSSIYRILCRNYINRVTQKEREKAKKFKEFEPKFLYPEKCLSSVCP